MPEGADDVQIFDSELRGFGIRKFKPSHTFPEGKVSFFTKFTVSGKQRRVTLGQATSDNLRR